jgi:hypothetical protein
MLRVQKPDCQTYHAADAYYVDMSRRLFLPSWDQDFFYYLLTQICGFSPFRQILNIPSFTKLGRYLYYKPNNTVVIAAKITST